VGADSIPADHRERVLAAVPTGDPAAAEMVTRFRAANDLPVVTRPIS
jgi:inactivated superfamily I helicase